MSRNRSRNRNQDPNRVGVRRVGRDLRRAGRQADRLGLTTPLSQLETARTTETQNLINQRRALSDPHSQGYAGRRSNDMQGFLSRMQDSTQGYNSRENNALREQRVREMERGFASGRAALARGQNAYGTGATQRGAQLLDLARTYGSSRADAENDLLIANADEKQRRLNQYGNVLGQQEQLERDRGQQALDAYAAQLREIQGSEVDKQKFNLGQEAASNALRSGAMFGILGINEARRNAAQQAQLVREGYRARGSGGGGGNQAYHDALMGIYGQMMGQPQQEEDASG